MKTNRLPPLEVDLINWPSETPTSPSPPASEPTILVFLHEGLGSVSGWQNFPARLCQASGLPGLVYSRAGYGRSAPLQQPLTPQFLYDAARVELNELLAAYSVSRAVLIGHSDGASIAVIRAGQTALVKTNDPASDCAIFGVIAIAPHLFIEPVCLNAISSLARNIAEKPERLAFLATQHNNAPAIFAAWTQAWLDPRFHGLDLTAEAAAIDCPVLAIQGDADQYGTLEQIHQLAALAKRGESLVLSDCRHSPHLEATERLLSACQQFVSSLNTGPAQ